MDEILKYFTFLDDNRKEKFKKLKSIYEFWNQRINVISRKDMDFFYLHHVLHSLAIAKVVKFKAFTEIMDAGTGGGFPGIPLAIMFPEVSFCLVDSIGKKIKVVNEVKKELGLNNVETENKRMEQVDRSFDFIVSRAVTDLEKFTRWTLYNIHSKSFNSIPNGILYLKGGDITEELLRVKKIKKLKYKIYKIEDIFEDDYFNEKYVVHILK
jgi:16S rRNA (guanine527-N7)-methyltransferase